MNVIDLPLIIHVVTGILIRLRLRLPYSRVVQSLRTALWLQYRLILVVMVHPKLAIKKRKNWEMRRNGGVLRQWRAQSKVQGLCGVHLSQAGTYLSTGLPLHGTTERIIEDYLKSSLITPRKVTRRSKDTSPLCSFVVKVRKSDYAQVMTPDFWPESVYVRKYYMARESKDKKNTDKEENGEELSVEDGEQNKAWCIQQKERGKNYERG
eukprot:GHVO01042542.1.p1 GENE.GHVO01042542.1~~GHVO01042542.1.p1  ORF type:complete len:209 (+),score=5.28 GHVO01042542.1:20-646(+)